MRRILPAILAGVFLTPLGCAQTPPEPASEQEMAEAQNREQKQADEAERQMNSENRAARKKK